MLLTVIYRPNTDMGMVSIVFLHYILISNEFENLIGKFWFILSFIMSLTPRSHLLVILIPVQANPSDVLQAARILTDCHQKRREMRFIYMYRSLKNNWYRPKKGTTAVGSYSFRIQVFMLEVMKQCLICSKNAKQTVFITFNISPSSQLTSWSASGIVNSVQGKSLSHAKNDQKMKRSNLSIFLKNINTSRILLELVAYMDCICLISG